jgi:hypothetical protein
MRKPYLLVALLTFALCASFFVSVQGADVAAVQPDSCDAVQSFADFGNGLPGSDSPPPLSSLPFQPFRLDDWGLMYLDYWRGEHFRSNAQVISLSLLGLFAAMAFVASPWRSKSPPPSDAESPYSIFIRTISRGTKCMDVLPSETLGSVKQRLQVITVSFCEYVCLTYAVVPVVFCLLTFTFHYFYRSDLPATSLTAVAF